MDNKVNWLLNWFKQNGSIPVNFMEEQLQINYFEAGLIDSLGVINLIVGIEEHFNIRFNEGHFQDRRFATIGGLSDIIHELSKS
jgi:acyl carrier protein